ncbi:carbohydrate kinase, putative [Plasmodium ovale wallikeri]|uniref:ATP-dependent (S)-NAD(P)H-hydrate dehydratase n=2 Tax=Plasmodium ovale TaxID=36330 RepID=A0A1A8YXR9_PLAOA|nr:carbohydrate kinase, putative [Plasmodium ovale wallikeri]SBT36250.1 carbohydrate kinase, putative [Plasmodium ovale wallikeri]
MGTPLRRKDFGLCLCICENTPKSLPPYRKRNMEEFPLTSSAFDHVQLNKKLQNQLLYELRRFVVPELCENDHKGCSGKICVVGGSEVYSGAPYFSAMSTLKLGADLCFIITSKECSLPLKCYSPELIVYPYLYNNKSEIKNIQGSNFEKCVHYLHNRIHSCVIGPGLGTIDNMTKSCIEYLISKFIQKNIFLIFDADAIQFLITNDDMLNRIKNYEQCMFTPNKNEFKNMISFLTDNKNITFDQLDCNKIILSAHKLMRIFNGPKILIKGLYDVYISKKIFFVSSINNPSLKRLAGLGDILTGLLAVFHAWGLKKKNEISPIMKNAFNVDTVGDHSECVDAISSFNASYFLKFLCKEGFRKNHRGVIASDIMNCIPHFFHVIYVEKYQEI